jgi:hypothetical protein
MNEISSDEQALMLILDEAIGEADSFVAVRAPVEIKQGIKIKNK